MKKISKKLIKEDILYDERFGNIPDKPEDRVAFILGKKSNNKKVLDDILRITKIFKRMKKKTIEFTMWKIVRPSARPRATTRRGYMEMYVPRAAENGEWFENFARENNLPYINTPCELYIEIYEKTPSSFSMRDKVLAELGYIRPWKRTGDFDNYAKTIADSIQHGMLEDDCLIVSSKQDLFYSIKPHAKVKIVYYEKFPKYK